MNNTTELLDSNWTNSKTLLELNSEEALNRLPVIIFISVLILLGIMGNVHVIYIYYRFFTTSTYRIFVLSLAVIDMVSCVISMPFEISDELNPYIFQDEIACKVFRFVNFTLAITTGLMLVVIASERYRRICRPQGKQLNEKESLYALIGVVACAFGATLPVLYIYGKKSIQIPGFDMIGTECTWGDHLNGSIIGYIFYGSTLLIVIACMVALIVLYGIVGKYLWRHTTKMSKNIREKYKLKEPIKLEVIEEETLEDVYLARDSFRLKISSENGVSPKTDDIIIETHNGNTTKISTSEQTNVAVTTNKSPSHPSKKSLLTLKRKREKNIHVCNMKGLQKAFRNITGREAGSNPLISKAEKSISDREKRITKVLFTITLLFIVSFLPYIVILVLYSVDESYERNMSNTQHVVYLIGLRLYLLNNVANPFLYSSFDSKFRKHLTDMYSILRALM
jgi:cell division protein FtsL